MTAAGAGAPISIVNLTGVCDVEGNGPDYLALSERPWLSIAPISLFAPGRWFKMRYQLGLYDRPIRPLISYRRGAQEIGWHILPGPVLGRAEWIGVVPKDASEVWISPVAEAGPFNFVIEAIEILSISDLFRMGLGGDRSRFFSALGTWALGWQNEARENFCWATQHAPMSEWPDHRDRFSVAPDLEGAERPRLRLVQGPDRKAYRPPCRRCFCGRHRSDYRVAASPDFSALDAMRFWRRGQRRELDGQRPARRPLDGQPARGR